jgi:adenylate kinase
LNLVLFGPPGSGKGTQAKLVDAGELVPDAVVIGIISERYDQPDCAKGAIFDGFPRTIPQAEALDAMLKTRDKKIDLVIELKVDDKVLIDRVTARIAQSGGAVRADDTPETLQNRLNVYYQNTAPLLDYYKKQGKLVTVDGMAPIDAVTKAVGQVIEKAGHRGCLGLG